MSDRRTQLDAFVTSNDWEQTDALVCIGVGDGSVWRVVHEVAPQCPIFIFDPDEERAHKYVPDGKTVIFWDIRAFTMGLVDKRKAAWSIQAIGLDDELEKEWTEKVVAAVRESHLLSTMRENTIRRFNAEWTHHLLRSIRHLPGKVTVNKLGGLFAGRPGIVVGAGPSLSRNVDSLAALQSRAVICSVNTSLAVLDGAGVTPHLCAVAESQDIMAHFKDVKCVGDVSLVTGPHVYSDVYDVPARRFMPAMANAGTAGEWLHKVTGGGPDLLGGGSVSCLAFRILDHLGCDPIILVGQDCAYEGTSTHADGARILGARWEALGEHPTRGDGTMRLYDNDGNYVRDDVYWRVPGWGGIGKVISPAALSCYRAWFENISLHHEGKRRLINATEGGAHIGGWDDQRLDRVAEWLPKDELDVEGIISAAIEAEEPIRADALIAALHSELEGLPALVEQSKEAREHIEAVIDAFETIPDAIQHAPLLASLGTSSREEAKHIPRTDAPFRALQSVYKRVEDKADELRPLIHEAIAALEVTT